MDRSQYPVPIVQKVFLQCPVEIKGTVDFQLVMVEGATIGEMVAALNGMGVNPRDLIVILQSIHAAGGLHAEILTI